ncbi:MAG: zinc metalloprotease HtpX [Sebaldella sp.]|nr:zinc metalloprotease HtpX [Sebaldella sp.]
MGNQIKTFVLMLFLALIFMFIGDFVGGHGGALFGLVIALGINFFSYWNSDKMVLSSYNAQEITDKNEPRIYNIVKNLTKAADLPMPKVYLIPEMQPNAFATGRNPHHAAVAVTRGLVETMDDSELSGVIGHELGHVKHRDILISTIASTFAAAITYASRFAMYSGSGRRSDNNSRGSNPFAFIMVLLAPVAALIVQMSISRKREFLADQFGAKISGNPLYLRNALLKLEAYSRRIPMKHDNPVYSHMFIINPLAKLGNFADLFRTHPPTSERIKKLEEMVER